MAMKTSDFEDLVSAADVAIQAALLKWNKRVFTEVFDDEVTKADLIANFLGFLEDETNKSGT